MDLHKTKSYLYDLPEELIAQSPVERRDQSRLMVIHRETGQIEDFSFFQIKDFLSQGDRLIFNDTKVIPARLFARKQTGAYIELLLTEEVGPNQWRAMAKPAKKLPIGTVLVFPGGKEAEVVAIHEDGQRTLDFQVDDFYQFLDEQGKMPLPPYINRSADHNDLSRYQTVYGKNPGAVAAPTAGLHFTPELLSELSSKGIDQQFVTLHVGLGTFKPVQVEDIREHPMHREKYVITPPTAAVLNQPVNREICVGTTSCRALESIACPAGLVQSGNFSTQAFFYPGYEFKRVKALLTNFHLPGSTLLMLTCAFAGYDLMMEAYRKAVKDRYRFFSYGDAMLIL